MGSVSTMQKHSEANGGLLYMTMGLACILLSASSYRQNSLGGVYPVDAALILRHLLAAGAALGAWATTRRPFKADLTGHRSATVCAVLLGCLVLCILAKYSADLLMWTNPVVVLVGNVAEELFSTLLIVFWACVIVPRGFRTTFICYGAALFVTTLCQFALTFFLKVPCMMVFAFSPLLSLAIYLRFCAFEKGQGSKSPIGDAPAVVDENKGPDAAGRPVPIALFGVVFCFSFLVGGLLMPSLSLQGDAIQNQLAVILGQEAAVCVLFVISKAAKQPSFHARVALVMVFLGIFAPTGAAFAISSSLGGIMVPVFIALTSVASQLTSSLVWIIPFMGSCEPQSRASLFSLVLAIQLVGKVLCAACHIYGDGVGPVLLAVVLAIVFALCLVSVMRVDGQHAVEWSEDIQEKGQVTAVASPVLPSDSDCVHVFAQKHGLTHRETVVFELLARGMNARQVSEALTISLNTSKSHMRVVYAKLGVHSRQELLDLVEDAMTSKSV